MFQEYETMKGLLDRIYVLSLSISKIGHGSVTTSNLLQRRFVEIDTKLRQRYENMDATDFAELFEDLDER